MPQRDGSRRLSTIPPPTRPGERPPIALVVGGSDALLAASHQAVQCVGGIALECDLASVWFAAFAWSPFAIIAGRSLFEAQGAVLRGVADGSGARLVRVKNEGPIDVDQLGAVLHLAIERWGGSVQVARAPTPPPGQWLTPAGAPDSLRGDLFL